MGSLACIDRVHCTMGLGELPSVGHGSCLSKRYFCKKQVSASDCSVYDVSHVYMETGMKSTQEGFTYSEPLYLDFVSRFEYMCVFGV